MTGLLTGLGLAGAAGLNAYIPLMAVAALGRAGIIQLAAPYDEITKTWALVVIGVFLLVELVVDKIPGADHVNDVVQTIVRPAAGAVLFGASTGAVHSVPTWIPIVAGLAVAFSVHTTKAVTRPVVTASTLGVGAPIISVIEDVFSAATAFVAILLPYLVVVFLLALVAGLVVLWRARAKRKARAAPQA